MLQSLRAAAKGWLAALLIGILAFAVGLFGITDIFGTGAQRVVATVGEVEISVTEFDREYRNEVRRFTERLGGRFDVELARALGLERQALDRLIDRAAVAQKALELGLVAQDGAVAAAIREQEAFRNPFGDFDPQQFIRVLMANQIGEAEFTELVRTDLVRAQLLETAAGGLAPPRGMIEALYAYLRERRVAEVLTLPAGLVEGEIGTPDDAALQTHIEENRAQFTAPEYRGLTVLAITQASVAEQLSAPDEEVAAFYEANRARYGTPERRTVEQVRFDDRAAAEAAKARIAGGETFLAVAQSAGFSAEDIALGTLTRDELPAAVGAAAFALDEGAISDPVEGPFGWVLVRVTAVTPGEQRALEEVRDEIVAELTRNVALDAMFELSNALQDELAGGATLEEAGTKLKLNVVTISAIDRSGNGPDGMEIELADRAAILTWAFEAGESEVSALEETPNGSYFAVRVNSVTPAQLRSLDSVREAALSGWREAAIRRALAARASELLSLLAGGRALGDVAAGSGGSLAVTEPIARGEAGGNLSASVITQLFASAPGQFAAGPAANGRDYVLATTREIIAPDPAANPAEVEELARALGEAWAGDLTSSFIRSLREEYGVTINEQVLATAAGRT